MRIARVELFYVKIPLAEREPGFFARRAAFHPNWIPGFRQTDVRFYLLRLVTDTGLDGVAAMPAMGLEREGLGPLLGAYLLGVNPLDMELVNQRIAEFSYIGMRNGWIDAAFWDLVGKIRKEPVWRVLGGSGGHVLPYASLGDPHDHDPRRVATLVKRRRDEGFAGVKIRVKSSDVERMVEVVAASRDAAGADMKLMVDANMGWPVDLLDFVPHWTLDFAADFARRIEPYDVFWLEECMLRADAAGLAELRRRTRTPIAGGEINSSWRDYRTMLDAQSLDVYQPDAVLAGGTLAGGISTVFWLIQAIEADNASHPARRPVRYSPHTWTNGLGFAVNLQLMGVVRPQDRLLLELPYDDCWEPAQWARFLRGGVQRDESGRIRIPDAPGLGVEIDWQVIRRFGRRLYAGTARTVAAATLRDLGLREAMHLRKKKKEVDRRSASATFSLPRPPF